jgi:hypothetical protein
MIERFLAKLGTTWEAITAAFASVRGDRAHKQALWLAFNSKR